MAQFGRALRSGRRSRGFESRHLDQKQKTPNGCFFVFALKDAGIRTVGSEFRSGGAKEPTGPKRETARSIPRCERPRRIESRHLDQKKEKQANRLSSLFSTKSADGGRNPLRWMKSLRDEILRRKVKGELISFHLKQ